MVRLDKENWGKEMLGTQTTARAVMMVRSADWAWLQQRHRADVPHDVWLLIVTPFQSQHVAVPGENDCLPPTVDRVFMGDHQVADGNVVPGCWQPRGRLVGQATDQHPVGTG